jgi:NAD-dependent DNA ligase
MDKELEESWLSSQELEKAIIEKNAEKLASLIQKYDELYYTGITNESEDIAINTLPSDALYEQAKSVYEQLTKPTIFHKMTGNSRYQRKSNINLMSLSYEPGILDDLWAGSIPKFETIKVISNDLLFMPKFDGVSCILRFKILDKQVLLDAAVTRGLEIAYRRKTSDIKNKVLKLELIQKLICNLEKQSYFPDLLQITIRGEIVLKSRDLLPNSPPAPYISGKINGGEDVWEKAINNIDFQPFEIIRVITGKSHMEKTFTTKQSQTNDILKNLGFPIVSYNIKTHEEESNNLINDSEELECINTSSAVKSNSNREFENPYRIYEYFLKSIKQPIDGIVYCCINWMYPQYKSSTYPSVYGKYAWKPIPTGKSKIIDFEYEINRRGQLGIIVIFETTLINMKRFSRMKIAISRMKELINKGIGIGSNIEFELSGGMTPIIKNFDKSINPYSFPSNCPYCGEILISESMNSTNRKLIPSLKCINLNCSGIFIQDILYFFKQLEIRNIGEAKVVKEIVEKPISKLALRQFLIKEGIFERIIETPLSNFLLAIGETVPTKINKWLELKGMTKLKHEPIKTIYSKLELNSESPFLIMIKELFK